MHDILDVIKNIDTIYNSNNSLAILKDFERVIDELDLYVFEHWSEGEVIHGPVVDRHWVTCKFMWPKDKMPNPEAAKRLVDQGCQVLYQKDVLLQPRKIREPDDIRPGTKKGKMNELPIWIVSIMMPKKLMLDVFRGYQAQVQSRLEPQTENPVPEVTEEPEELTALDQGGME